MRSHSKEYLLTKLKLLAEELGRYPRKDEIDASNITPHSYSYYLHFRNLRDAFRALHLFMKSTCPVCKQEFKSNQALAVHRTQKPDKPHRAGYKSWVQQKRNEMEKFRYVCNICKRRFRTKKGRNDHVFSSRVIDKAHTTLKNRLKEKRFANALKVCAVCKRRFFRSMCRHLKCAKDAQHKRFLKQQKQLILRLFQKGYSFADLALTDHRTLQGYAPKYFMQICTENLGKEKAMNISNKIIVAKRKAYWTTIATKKRKKIMRQVREAQWGKLSAHDRKKHPWVIAGRLASLASSKRGSKNQEYAFELLREYFPTFSWRYNYAIDEDWQIDIAVPDQSLFIEWDGRHHFVPIYGQSYLNNRRNRDRYKDRIVTKVLNGCMIRVKDMGRKNDRFVKEKVKEISGLINKSIPTGKVIQL